MSKIIIELRDSKTIQKDKTFVDVNVFIGSDDGVVQGLNDESISHIIGGHLMSFIGAFEQRMDGQLELLIKEKQDDIFSAKELG